MKTRICLWWGYLTSLSLLVAQETTPAIEGSVTLPYQMLRSLERDKPGSVPKKIEQASLLQSAHYRIDLSKTPAEITAAIRVQHYSEDVATTPVLTSDISVSELLPEDAALFVKQDLLQLITEKPGKYEITLKIIPEQASTLTVLPCASSTVTIAGLGEGENLEWNLDGNSQVLSQNTVLGIPARGATVSWKHLRGDEAKSTNGSSAESVGGIWLGEVP